MPRQPIEAQQASLVALGLLPPGTDLRAQLEALLAGGVIGFYDPRSAELVVRGVDDSPATRRTLVDERAHALQDQVFDLDRPEVDAAHDEQSTALSALAEGDAERVEAADVSRLPAAGRSAPPRHRAGPRGGRRRHRRRCSCCPSRTPWTALRRPAGAGRWPRAG